MDVGSASGIASLATAMAQERFAQQLGVAVLRKALDVQASAAMALVAALPPPVVPSGLGQHVNTYA